MKETIGFLKTLADGVQLVGAENIAKEVKRKEEQAAAS